MFFALWPDDRQRDELRNTISPAVSGVEGTIVYRGNWHITLVFIGSVPDARLAALQQLTSAVDVERLRLRLDRLEFWARPKVACVTPTAIPESLEHLVAKLEGALRPLGFESEDRVYRPHITVARRVRAFAPEPLARPVTLEWSSFELMESVSTGRGVQYRPLKQELRHDS